MPPGDQRHRAFAGYRGSHEGAGTAGPSLRPGGHQRLRDRDPMRSRSRLSDRRLPHWPDAACHAPPGRATSRRPDARVRHGLPPGRL